MNESAGVLTAIAAVASLIGVAVLVWEVYSSRSADLMRFFAEYNDRYDRTMSTIPLSVFLDNWPARLDEIDSNDERLKVERAVYEYFALCEEELNLFADGSTGRTTHRFGHRKIWESVKEEWESGIAENMKLAIFQSCWSEFDERLSAMTRARDEQATPVLFDKLRTFCEFEGGGKPTRWWRFPSSRRGAR
jgi:hypothetical protein